MIVILYPPGGKPKEYKQVLYARHEGTLLRFLHQLGSESEPETHFECISTSLPYLAVTRDPDEMVDREGIFTCPHYSSLIEIREHSEGKNP